MTRYITVAKSVWKDKRGRDRLGASIITGNGRRIFVDRHELREVCDELHDVAEQYDRQTNRDTR